MSRGREIMERMVGEGSTKKLLEKFEAICPDYAKYTVDFAFGELHGRGVLSDMEREIAIVSCLIGQRNSGTALKIHLRAMLNVGWSEEKVKELILLLIAYAGFPDTVAAMECLKEVLDER